MRYPMIIACAVLLACILLSLPGCGFTASGDAIRESAAIKGAQAYDEGLANAEWFMCTAASIGSIRRNYCRTQDGCDRYMAFCQAAVEMRGLGGAPTP